MDGRLRRRFRQSMARFDVLSHLERVEGHCLPIGVLADRLLVSGGNITGLLTRMERDGLLTREVRPDNRRSVNVTLTGKGLALFERMAIEHGEWAQDAFAKLAIRDMELLLDQLLRARASLEQATPTEELID